LRDGCRSVAAGVVSTALPVLAETGSHRAASLGAALARANDVVHQTGEAGERVRGIALVRDSRGA
jgi:hypothetical protein